MNNADQLDGNEHEYRFIAGRKVLFDPEGFLWNPEDWSKDVAESLARESGLENLDDSHWKVINFLRDFYFTNGRAP